MHSPAGRRNGGAAGTEATARERLRWLSRFALGVKWPSSNFYVMPFFFILFFLSSLLLYLCFVLLFSYSHPREIINQASNDRRGRWNKGGDLGILPDLGEATPADRYGITVRYNDATLIMASAWILTVSGKRFAMESDPRPPCPRNIARGPERDSFTEFHTFDTFFSSLL